MTQMNFARRQCRPFSLETELEELEPRILTSSMPLSASEAVGANFAAVSAARRAGMIGASSAHSQGINTPAILAVSYHQE